jgi:apolipoprotein D and lipocalin family protein
MFPQLSRLVGAALAALVFVSVAPDAADARYRDRSVPMAVVSNLDLNRYLGLWYEIARFPNRFERDCVAVTAEYGLLPDGTISVRNSCRKFTFDGELQVAEGTARVEGPGRLSVNFVPWLPFARGPYWILDIAPDYSVAVVGEPSGSTGWILARSPRISRAAMDRALGVLRTNGYDTDALYMVPQP